MWGMGIGTLLAMGRIVLFILEAIVSGLSTLIHGEPRTIPQAGPALIEYKRPVAGLSDQEVQRIDALHDNKRRTHV